MRADLLLLDGDPLTDVKNTSRIAGVVAAGRWLPAEELHRKLVALRASY
jgi:imidazolonepropionase-like amidohydrolase